MKKSNICKSVFVCAVAGAAALGALSATAEARRPIGGCVCPMYYAPVLCSNGVVYSNICFAGCAGATGCVPTGPGPVPI